MKAWLKGGLIGLIFGFCFATISLIYSIFFILSGHQSTSESLFLRLIDPLIGTPIGICANTAPGILTILCIPILVHLAFFILTVPLGILIGWIIGKIKSRT